MPPVKLRNVNPLGHVDLVLIGREGPADDEPGRGCLIPGEVFEVTEAQAGVAPHWRLAEDGENLTGLATRLVGDADADEDAEPVLEVLDPGHGLLAQVGNYELATASDGLDKHTIPELVELAATRDIDLGGATKKADILDAIRKG